MPDARDSEIEGFLRSHGPFEQPPRHPCGERIGDWKILAFLGRGGSSEVYRAKNTVTGIVAALKILYRSDDNVRERFRREVRLVAEMRSAAFPKFYGAGECDGQLYLAEELLETAPLPMRDAAVAHFILGVCAGVDRLHRLGFVHRDIKPGNVMVRPSTGESVLIDMGLAKGIDETPQTRNETLSVVDGHAVGVGTPGFSAPEQFAGGRISAATDIHAIGMLANACFGGKPPKAWTTIIRRSTSSIPEQRYATVEEFARAVRHRWRGLKLAVAFAILGIAILGMFIWATSINDGDYWLRQAWLTGRQMRTIKQSFGDKDMRHPAEVVANAEPEPKKVKSEDASSLLSLGRTTDEGGIAVTRIALNGRNVQILGEINLDESCRIVIDGPGRIVASISGIKGVKIELGKQAALINLTDKPYPQSGIRYTLQGACYLNFKNLDSPGSDLKNIWVDDLGGNGRPIIRFRGRHDTYDEAVKEQKKIAIELMKKGQFDWI